MRQLITLVLFIWTIQVSGQTCCSAGAPVSNFYSIANGAQDGWAFNLSYEYKSINLLVDNNQRLVNDPRTRFGQSALAKVDYLLNKKLSFAVALPLVYQSRKTVSSSENSLGLGDVLLISQINVFNKNSFLLNLSGGLKLPTGQLSHKSDNSILLSPDMQSGSGSIDWILGFNIAMDNFLIPFFNLNANLSYRNNGINSSFGQTLNFSGRRIGFGDELVSTLSFNYQIVGSTGFYIPDLSIKYRSSRPNIEQTVEAPNSGGYWLSLPMGISFQPSVDKTLRMYVEFPLAQELNGLQITTNFTAGVQVRYMFNNNSLDIN